MLKLRVKYDAATTAEYFADDASLGEREKMGVWLGSGCDTFGAAPDSPVMRDHLKMALSGFDLHGRRMYQRQVKARRCGWDTVFAPDKSVSVAGLCLDSALSDVVYNAFVQVGPRLTRWIERMASRQDFYQARPVRTNNVTAARFTHETSRHNDPHLHLHLLLLNATWDSAEKRRANKWKALETLPIYRTHSILDHLANRELARLLHIAGVPASLRQGRCTLPVPRALCDNLSKAHRAIMAMLAEQPPPKLQPPAKPVSREHWANHCNDRTRPAKTPVSRRPDLRRMVEDRAKVTEVVRSAPPTLNTEVPAESAIPEIVERDLYANSTAWSEKERWAAAARVASAYPMAPVEPILDAALSMEKPAPFFDTGFSDHQDAVNAAEYEEVFLKPKTPAKTATPRRRATRDDDQEVIRP